MLSIVLLIFLSILMLSLIAASPAIAGVDADADGVPQGSDCDDQNSQVWAVPGETRHLTFGSKVTLLWEEAADIGGRPSSARYDTLRSASASNFAGGSGTCLDPDGLTGSTTDAAIPAPGTAFFYLTRMTNACGDGSLGNRSNGMPRSGTTCDCSILCDDGQSCTRDMCVDGACAHDTIEPTIEERPQAVAVCPGDDAHFVVRAAGQGTLHYQWRKGPILVGGDAPTLSLTGLTTGDNGSNITCVVTDGCASATTEAAVLTVFTSAASCSGGSEGQEAPGGASATTEDDLGTKAGTSLMGNDLRTESPRGSVYLFSGEYFLEDTDLVIQGRGFDFAWTRKYRSREPRLSGQGYNWDFSYNRFVTHDSPGTDLILADGSSRRDRYQLTPSGCWAAQGLFRELCLQPDGTYLLTFPSKTTWKFKALDGSPSQGKIQEVRDSNQNSMTFSYDAGGRLVAVTDTLGRATTVSYNADGYISGVTDFAGRQISYAYYGPIEAGGMPGDLKSVTGPAVTGTPNGNDFPAGKTTTYIYTKDMPHPALDHNLLTITDPSGRVVLRNTYTTSTVPSPPGHHRFDRIDRQSYPNGTIDYVYVAASDPGSDAVTKTIVNDRAGHVKEVFSNALNQTVMVREYTGTAPSHALPTDDSSNRPTGKLRPSDPDSFETRFTFSPDSLLTSVLLPEGNSIQYTYDSGNPDVRLRANLLQRVSNPGPRGGDQSSITETWTHEPGFGSEPCLRGFCGEGGGAAVEAQEGGKNDGAHKRPGQTRSTRTKSKNFYSWYMYSALPKGNPRWIERSYQPGKPRWYETSYQDGRGHIYTRDLDPVTGNVLQATAPTVTTGVLGGGMQTISESWQYNAFGQVIRHTNPSGRIDEYTYYSSGPQTGYLKDVKVDASGPIPGSHFVLLTVTARDALGNVTALTDPRGNTATFVYNELDQIVRQVARPPFSYQTDYCYDANDHLVRVEAQNLDESGATRPNASISTVFTYDDLDHLVRTTVDGDTVNLRTEYEYDANDQVILLRLPEAVNGHQPGNVVRTLYDERDLRLRTVGAEGDPAASSTRWDYDGNGNVVAIREGLEATPRVTSFTYDGYDRQIASIDATGNVTTRHYNANGNTTSIRKDGELIEGESGPNVRLSKISIVYDEVNRSVQQDIAFFDVETGIPIGDGSSTSRAFYNEASQIVRSEDDNGHATVTSYDSADRVSSTLDAKGNSSTNGYDANGNLLAVTEMEVSDLPAPSETFVTTSTFDALDRRTSTTDNAGHVHQFFWDSRGNQTLAIDAKGNETRATYDALGRLTRTERVMRDTGEGGGNVVFVLDETRSYDDDSRLVQQTDDNGHSTSYQYDALGRLVTTTYADGTTELQAYDVHHNPVGAVDANGTVITSTFDALNRLRTKSISRAAGVLGTTSETWSYDGLSRVVRAENDESEVALAYAIWNKIKKEVVRIGTGDPRTVTSAFDGAGNRTSVTYPSGLTVSTAHDELDRKKTITASGPGTCTGGATPGAFCVSGSDCLPGGTCTPLAPLVTTYDYMGPARVIRRVSGGNLQSSYAYDTDRRMTRTTHVKLVPYAEIADRAYTWDAMDNKTARIEMLPLSTGTVHTYAYDSAYRMTRSIETAPGMPPVTIDYALDGVGNRTSVTGGAESGPYSMNALLPEPADLQVNQYTSTPFDGARISDRNGNLVEKPGTGESMSYDYNNRMVQSSGSLGPVTYAYDPFRRRIRAGGKQYVHDGDREIEEWSSSGALSAAYVHGNGLDDVDMAVADVSGDGRLDRSYPLTDDQGNVIAVTDLSGELLERYDYDDGGKPRFFGAGGSPLPQSAIGNPVLFNSHRYDDTTGLYDYRTRDLDPRAGRFTSRDSLGTWGDEGNLGNGYSYAGNNPWTNLDPMGRSFFDVSVAWPDPVVCPCPPYAPSGMVCGCGLALPSGGGVGTVGLSKWECYWGGGTWVHDLTDGYCIMPLQPMQIVGTASGFGAGSESPDVPDLGSPAARFTAPADPGSISRRQDAATRQAIATSGAINGPMNSPMNSPMNGTLNGPMNSPMNGALNRSMGGSLQGTSAAVGGGALPDPCGLTVYETAQYICTCYHINCTISSNWNCVRKLPKTDAFFDVF